MRYADLALAASFEQIQGTEPVLYEPDTVVHRRRPRFLVHPAAAD